MANFYMDSRQVNALTGFLKELSIKIGTPQYVGPVLKYVHAEMSTGFTEHMSAVAPVREPEFHHVYEWDAIGVPQAQLWRDVLRGGGAIREATWEWRASKKTVPVAMDFNEHGDSVGVKQIHVFVWKAPVMEYETNITIAPQGKKGISFFTGPATPADKWAPVRFSPGPITVQYPGGEAAHGSFTREYVAWWGGAPGEEFFNRNIRGLLERELKDMPLGTAVGPFRAGTRSRTKTLGIVTMADSAEAERIGRESARMYLESRNRRYIDAARAREAIISGGLSD